MGTHHIIAFCEINIGIYLAKCWYRLTLICAIVIIHCSEATKRRQIPKDISEYYVYIYIYINNIYFRVYIYA